MIRKLGVLIAALVSAAAFTVVAPTSAQASVIPTQGSYNGVDHGGRTVTFTFHGNTVMHFSVSGQVIGGAHVSNGMWHETCHNGLCFRGQWHTDGFVTGSWRHGSSAHWTAWSARVAPPISPYSGTYMGRDHAGAGIHFRYVNQHVMEFRIGGHTAGNVVVQAGRFEVCHGTYCFKGQWDGDYSVVGQWRHLHSSSWTAWEAHAYAS